MPTLIGAKVTREQKIGSILVYRHGVATEPDRAFAVVNWTPDDPRNVRFFGNKPSPEVSAAVSALKALPDEQLDAQYHSVLKEIEEAFNARRAREEAARPFNGPNARADFAHWAKCTYWTVEEAVALVLARNPQIVTPKLVAPYREVSSFAQLYERILDLANRGVLWGQLTKPVAPGVFIAWAKRYDIPVPPELEVEVEKYGHFIGDWKTLFDTAKGQLDRAQALEVQTTKRAEGLQAEVERLSEALALANHQSAKKSDAREIDSLRKLVIGMAIQGYKYDPAGKRNAAISDIVGDLDLLGLSLDADTVRSHLKKSAELLSPDAGIGGSMQTE